MEGLLGANNTMVNGQTTRYYYTGGVVLYTANSQHVLQSENILTPSGNTIASKRFSGEYANKWYFFQYDVRGSVTNIVDPNGNMVKGYNYDTFGKKTDRGNANFDNEVTYTSSVYDKASNLQYMNARFYDTATGRFISQDSYAGNAAEPWTQHLYVYCGNNPVNMVDPTGHNAIAAALELAGKAATQGAAATGATAGLGPWAFVIGAGVFMLGLMFGGSIGGTDKYEAAPAPIPAPAPDHKPAPTPTPDPDKGKVVPFPGNPPPPKAIPVIPPFMNDISDKAQNNPDNRYDDKESLHHIVARTADAAENSRNILTAGGIGINDPDNLVSLSTRYHHFLHNAAYYTHVNDRMDRAMLDAMKAIGASNDEEARAWRNSILQNPLDVHPNHRIVIGIHAREALNDIRAQLLYASGGY